MKGTLEHRLAAAKYTLELSYDLVTHYDNKTNQQLTIAGFDFAIISMLITAMFTSTSCGTATKLVIMILATISYVLLAIALWETRKALMPHVKHHKGVKLKPGLLYFMDIKNNFGEEEYVSTLMGKELDNATISRYYENTDESSFEYCFIEDCARDIYAHALILDEKTKHVRNAFTWVFATTISSIVTVAVTSVLWFLGV